MAKAIGPNEFPKLPEGASYWSRSTRRADSVFHAHTLGFPVCGARFRLDRNHSVLANGLGDMKYHGVCPRCFALSKKVK